MIIKIVLQTDRKRYIIGNYGDDSVTDLCKETRTKCKRCIRHPELLVFGSLKVKERIKMEIRVDYFMSDIVQNITMHVKKITVKKWYI
ncbi:hypothetical protein GWI33_014731 [Rhynchophorus ferrugineus]|uniref:Uncharacterized protein n=1 Tax=Rhynchophorus ferrugineus TaxID=354439 RepID=A0A834I4J1_RHYFE|nr:hypothetical protein GWI33_014731 [Rhynchophorus ferrugineus]